MYKYCLIVSINWRSYSSFDIFCSDFRRIHRIWSIELGLWFWAFQQRKDGTLCTEVGWLQVTKKVASREFGHDRT